MRSEKEMIDRITEHYHRILMRSDYKDNNEYLIDKNHFNETISDVVETLLPYARRENYWWEQKGPEMAYFQLITNLIVVKDEDFKKAYKALMGKKFDGQKLRENPKKIIDEATRRYKKLLEKNNKSRR